MTINPRRICGTCENCWMRRVPCDLKVRDIPVEFIYDIYCRVDNKTLGGDPLHNSRAELCKHYKERKNDTH